MRCPLCKAGTALTPLFPHCRPPRTHQSSAQSSKKSPLLSALNAFARAPRGEEFRAKSFIVICNCFARARVHGLCKGLTGDATRPNHNHEIMVANAIAIRREKSPSAARAHSSRARHARLRDIL